MKTEDLVELMCDNIHIHDEDINEWNIGNSKEEEEELVTAGQRNESQEEIKSSSDRRQLQFHLLVIPYQSQD